MGRYGLRVECSGLQCLLTINGCAALALHDGSGQVVRHGLSPWLLAGVNELKVYLSPLAHGDFEAKRHFFCSFFRYADPEGSGSDDVVLAYRYTENETQLENERMTLVLSHALHIPEERVPWPFEQARSYRAEDQPDVLATVRHLHRAYASRNREAIVDMYALKNAEIARGLGLEARHLQAVQEAYVSALFASERWELEPLDENALTIQTTAEGKLVHVRAEHHMPPIRGVADGVPFGEYVTLGHLQDAWCIVR